MERPTEWIMAPAMKISGCTRDGCPALTLTNDTEVPLAWWYVMSKLSVPGMVLTLYEACAPYKQLIHDGHLRAAGTSSVAPARLLAQTCLRPPVWRSARSRPAQVTSRGS